jgi:hypothetical protein
MTAGVRVVPRCVLCAGPGVMTAMSGLGPSGVENCYIAPCTTSRARVKLIRLPNRYRTVRTVQSRLGAARRNGAPSMCRWRSTMR